MKARIIETQDGFFTQVKVWWIWMRVSSVNLSLFHDLAHPSPTLKEAEEVLEKYKLKYRESKFEVVRKECEI